jgi:transglutaminase-like putative cysteine protease
MHIHAGFRLTYDCMQPTPMLLALNLHPSRRVDLLTPQVLTFDPPLQAWDYVDSFGNACSRILAPAGRLTISSDFTVYDSGQPDVVPYDARQHDVSELPDDVLVYLLGSRYCETDRLGNLAWQLFGHTPLGWPRVQAVLDYVHNRLRFDYQLADATRTAHQGHEQQVGVCRDFTPPRHHLLPGA